jgi:hypothetical protein
MSGIEKIRHLKDVPHSHTRGQVFGGAVLAPPMLDIEFSIATLAFLCISCFGSKIFVKQHPL